MSRPLRTVRGGFQPEGLWGPCRSGGLELAGSGSFALAWLPASCTACPWGRMNSLSAPVRRATNLVVAPRVTSPPKPCELRSSRRLMQSSAVRCEHGLSPWSRCNVYIPHVYPQRHYTTPSLSRWMCNLASCLPALNPVPNAHPPPQLATTHGS